MNLLLGIAIVIVVGIIAIIIAYVNIKNKVSSKVYELEARNEILETQYIEVGQQLCELMKLKEQADERLFNLDKYVGVAMAEKELTYQQINRLEQQIEHDKELMEQLQFGIQEAGKLQTKAESELCEAKTIIENYQNELGDLKREIDHFS
jgi:chromosome segregation ATPase